MATISTRVDDQLKLEAEQIADDIGIPLSTAVNIFLKQFIAHQGFPFKVVRNNTPYKPIVNLELLDASVKKAIADPTNKGISHQFTYIDPQTNKPITVTEKE